MLSPEPVLLSGQDRQSWRPRLELRAAWFCGCSVRSVIVSPLDHARKALVDALLIYAHSGGLRMSEPVTLHAPSIEPPPVPSSKWEREYRAFLRLLPELLVTHRGQYVAIHHEQVVDSGDDKLQVALRVLAKVGNVAIHVARVTAEVEPIALSGVRRELRPMGGDR